MTDFRQFFHPDYGLKARTAAKRVLEAGPLLLSPDDRFWGYAGGVWAEAEKDLHARTVDLLDERFRAHHETEIRGVIKRMVGSMDINPTGRYINFSNGMVAWDAEGKPEKLPHHEEYLSTVQLPVRYVEGAKCPEFDAFIAEAVAEDDRGRVWEVIGYLMMSGNPLQKMFLLTGSGGNGKGVLLHVIMSILGKINVANVPLHAFINDRFAPARLYNRLANVCGDIDVTYIEQTGLIKQLAGEDLIDGERKYGQPFQFEFWGKSIFSANGIPASADPSFGWVRRWEVVDFPNAPRRPDRGLKRRLSTDDELEGIAARAVLALRDLMARGAFVHGAAATAVHDEFAQRSNKVLQWLTETTFEDPSSWYDRPTMVKRFRVWDAYNNPSARVLGTQKFYEMVRGVLGHERKRRGIYGFAGRRFLEDIAYSEVVDGSAESDDENAPSQGGNSGFSQPHLV
jgi:putative DNA primase/helicase